MPALSDAVQLADVIALQESALAQHEAAERHWLAAGDEDRTDAAIWRQGYVSDLIVQLRRDLAGLDG